MSLSPCRWSAVRNEVAYQLFFNGWGEVTYGCDGGELEQPILRQRCCSSRALVAGVGITRRVLSMFSLFQTFPVNLQFVCFRQPIGNNRTNPPILVSYRYGFPFAPAFNAVGFREQEWVNRVIFLARPNAGLEKKSPSRSKEGSHFWSILRTYTLF